MEFVHGELSYQILGVLFEVNKEVGYGHKEYVYQKAICALFRSKNIPFQEQVRSEIRVAGEVIGELVLDFLVEEKIILELKASNHFRSADYRQVKTYLNTTGLQLAILATFTPNGVRYQRVLNLPDYPMSVSS